MDGEEWLQKLVDVVNSKVDRYMMSERSANLVKNRKLRVLGDPNMKTYIGAKPTCDDPDDSATCKQIYNGETAVVHGEVVSGAAPSR